jgi:hypothetical protein
MRCKKRIPPSIGPSRPRHRSRISISRLIPRDDLKLVQVVTELGGKANGYCAELKVVDVPADVRWEIEKTRGVEHVSERHRTWG